jgi:hypothetical protein
MKKDGLPLGITVPLCEISQLLTELEDLRVAEADEE